MLHVLGVRAGISLVRPAIWTAGGLLVAFVAGSAALPLPAAAGGSTLPVAGATVTQGFGCTNVLFEPVSVACASGHFHSGVDLAARPGTPVYSVCSGAARVVRDAGGYGTHVVVECGAGLRMLYGHLAATAFDGAANVSAAALLGWVGSTGLSTGPHLHFEVRRAGTPVDPMPWLPAYAGGTTHRRDQRW